MNVGLALLISACPSACLSVHCFGHSNLVIITWISSKLNIWIAAIELSPKFEYGFHWTKIAKMADKMATAYQFALVDTLP